MPYLKSVAVIASNREDALALAKEWLKKNGKMFIEKDEKKWAVNLVQEGVERGVFDYVQDSDY